MKVTINLIIILLLVGAAGCSDDDPTSVKADPLIFLIDVSIEPVWNGAPTMNVSLAMENPGEIPSFSANGESVSSFSLHRTSVLGSLTLPLADTIEFTLSSKNRNIGGTIKVPKRPDVMTCNGIELVEGPGNEMEATGRYEFTWSGGVADYYDCYMSLYDRDLGFSWHSAMTEGEEWTVEEADRKPDYCVFSAWTGTMGEPGDRPDFSSSWAEGYYVARDDLLSFSFSAPSNKQKLRPSESAMDRLDKILANR